MRKDVQIKKVEGDSLTPIMVFNRLEGPYKCLL